MPDRRREPLLSISKDLPSDWCLSPIYPQIKQFETEFGFGRPTGPLIVASGCKIDDDCLEKPASCVPKAIPCDPEAMRADAEQKLKASGVWPQNKPLSLDTYALARNLMSEFGRGSPSEKIAVALVALNRASQLDGTDPKQPGAVASHIIGKTGKFGQQIGSLRPASTRQDPSVADILIADLILQELKRDQLRDITHGATHYLDRETQDAMVKSGRTAKTGVEVYTDWANGGDALTWVGQSPDIRPWRLMLMRRRPELRGDPVERQRIFTAGLNALKGKNRPIQVDRICFEPSRLREIAVVAALGIGSFALVTGIGKLGASVARTPLLTPKIA
jgi:hypothetical protein